MTEPDGQQILVHVNRSRSGSAGYCLAGEEYKRFCHDVPLRRLQIPCRATRVGSPGGLLFLDRLVSTRELFRRKTYPRG